MKQDEDIRRSFEELRRSDEGSAPSFRQVLARMRTGRPVPLRRAAAAAALLAAAVLAVALLLWPAHQAPKREPAATIAQWKSPTGWLLRTTGSQLLEELPALPDPLPSASLPEGVEKTGSKTPTVHDGRRP
jgi:hypothetical protein